MQEETVGQKLIRLRLEKNLSQLKLSFLSEISLVSIVRIENGEIKNPSKLTIARLNTVFPNAFTYVPRDFVSSHSVSITPENTKLLLEELELHLKRENKSLTGFLKEHGFNNGFIWGLKNGSSIPYVRNIIDLSDALNTDFLKYFTPKSRSAKILFEKWYEKRNQTAATMQIAEEPSIDEMPLHLRIMDKVMALDAKKLDLLDIYLNGLMAI